MLLEKNQVHPKAFMEELTWEQVRNDVMKVNPEFAAVVDRLSPSREYTVFKATYPYGSEILKRGDLYLPNSLGEIVPFNDNSINNHIRECLGYNLKSNPVTLVLKNSLELFLTMEDRTVPLYGIISPGKIFGLSRVWNQDESYQPAFIWDMTAGARSLFMLPKISEAERHYKLKKFFHLNVDPPKTLMDHWQIFKEISNHSDFPEPWSVEILFFSKNWFDHLNDPSWIDFYYYLLSNVWKVSEFWRNQFFWDLMFSIIQKNKNIKPSPYISDTVKYLFAISVGALPGFFPAINSLTAPIKGLQDVYLNIYNLKNYPTVIMQPGTFSMNDLNSRPVYYSLQFPNAIDFAPKTRNRSSLITDLYQVKSLLSKCLSEISSGQFKMEATPLYNLTRKVDFNYFHNNVELYHGMRESREIPLEDDSFFRTMTNCQNKEFPATSTFVKGCIRVSHKKND